MRDLLAVELDIVDFLPADDSSSGFDNNGDVLRMSQSLLERYLAAAKVVSRLAVGGVPTSISELTPLPHHPVAVSQPSDPPHLQ